MTPKDPYYSRTEVSNSLLTAFYYKLYPQMNFVSDEAKQKAFHLGTLVDALVTEPDKVNVYLMQVDDEQYTKEEFEWGKKMWRALVRHSRKDKFLAYVLDHAETQKVLINPEQHFKQGCFDFCLATRCKFDWFLNGTLFGDLKTTSCTTYDSFLTQYKDIWLRGRVFYMNLAHSLNPLWGNQDFVYAISKQNQKVFFFKLMRDSDLFREGEKKLNELAFRYWMLKA